MGAGCEGRAVSFIYRVIRCCLFLGCFRKSSSDMLKLCATSRFPRIGSTSRQGTWVCSPQESCVHPASNLKLQNPPGTGASSARHEIHPSYQIHPKYGYPPWSLPPPPTRNSMRPKAKFDSIVYFFLSLSLSLLSITRKLSWSPNDTRIG